MLRSLVAMMSVFLAATCPLWCASVEAAWHASSSHHSCERNARGDSPSPRPVNDDDCLCQGAVSTPAVEDEAAPSHAAIAFDPGLPPVGGACAAFALTRTFSGTTAWLTPGFSAASRCVVLRC